MIETSRDGPDAKVAKRWFGVVFGVLFAFWAAMAVCVAAIVIVAVGDGRGSKATAAASTAPAVTPAPTATPVSSPTPEPRPSAVPSSAQPLDSAYDSGEPQQHLLFHIGCADGILTVATTDEQVYAETDCPAEIQRVFVEPFLGDPVRITVAEGGIDIVTIDGERLTFPIGRVWIEQR
jgi:hypothetical protein